MIKNVISAFRIDTIHIHHMIGHYFDIADVAKENNIKLIITLHDYYSLCPTINMLYMMEKCCIDIPQNKKDCNGSTMYIFRRGNDNIYRLSKPCKACMQCILDYGIKRIVYTIENGIKEIYL